jgi:PAS domain S-box-containing protein
MSQLEVTRRVEDSRVGAAVLQERDQGTPAQPQALLIEQGSELQTRLQELEVAVGELRAQKEELIAARQGWALECQHYQGLFMFAPEGYLVTDTRGIVLEANRAAASLLHTKTDSLLGRPLANFVAGAERREFRSETIRLGQSQVNEKRDWEVRLKPYKAPPFDAEFTVSVLHEPKGKTSALYWQVRDVTRGKQAKEVLEHNRRKWEAQFDRASAAIFLADDEARYQEANPAACNLLGYSREELLGLKLWDLLPVPNVERGKGSWRIFIAEGKQSGEYTLRRKDGTSVEVEYRAVTNIMPGLHLMELNEVTERKRRAEAEREQRILAEALRETAVALSSTLDWDAVLDRILADVGRVVPHDAAYIILVDSGIGRVVRSWGYAERGQDEVIRGLAFPIEELSDFSQMMETDQALVASEAESFLNWVVPRETRWVRSHLSAPIRVESQVIGFLGLASARRGFFTAAHAANLQAFGNQAALALENARHFEAERQRNAELVRSSRLMTTLSQTATRVASSLNMDSVLETLGIELRRFGFTCMVALAEQDRRTFSLSHVSIEPEILAQIRELTGLNLEGLRIELYRLPLFSKVLSQSSPMFVERASSLVEALLPEMKLTPGELAPRQSNITSDAHVILMPLSVEDQKLGVLALCGKGLRAEDTAATSIFGKQVSIAIANARLFEEVRAGRERLQALSSELVSVQETERRTIARELHHEIGQFLTGLQLNLDMMPRLPVQEQSSALREALGKVNEIVGRLHDLSVDLRPSMLDDLGLLPAVAWYVERYTSQSRVYVTLQHNQVEGQRFPREVETAAYRIVQDALTNVYRHSGASRATVRVWAVQDMLSVQTEGKGIGFDPEAIFSASGYTGLLGMRERVALLGGQLKVDPSPTGGTCLTAELPLGGYLERRKSQRRLE